MSTPKVVLLMSLSLFALAGCGGAPEPPVAAVKPHTMTLHGDTRVDDYYWLNERDNPEVIAYLEAENAYLDAVMDHTKDFQAALFKPCLQIPGHERSESLSPAARRDAVGDVLEVDTPGGADLCTGPAADAVVLVVAGTAAELRDGLEPFRREACGVRAREERLQRQFQDPDLQEAGQSHGVSSESIPGS